MAALKDRDKLDPPAFPGAAGTPAGGAQVAAAPADGASGSYPGKPMAALGSRALALWREKRDFLREQEAIAADPAQKFALMKQIEEAERKIRELGIQAPVDFVIVTALEEELDAVLRQLPSYWKLPPSAADVRVYFGADLPVTFSDGTAGAYSAVVVTLLNMGRFEAATAVGDAVRRWRPRYVVLVGIAGGFSEEDVALGDLLISDQVVDYELQKITEEGPKVRYRVHAADPRLLGAAQSYQGDGWYERVSAPRPADGRPRRVIGPIATGDKVVAFGKLLDRYQAHWPKLIGVEMEAGGAASACFQAAQAPGIFMIRSVSDLADADKDSDEVRRWRAYACEVAAAYAVALLESGPVVAGTREDPR